MLLQDLRYAFRSLARKPGSLGIGATTAIFSVVQAVLQQPDQRCAPIAQ